MKETKEATLNLISLNIINFLCFMFYVFLFKIINEE